MTQLYSQDVTPPVISLVASSTTAGESTITWTTNEAATSTVNYGDSISYGTASSSANSVTLHSITLTGLTAATLYHFQVASTDAAGNNATSSDFTFTTASADITPPVISVVASSTNPTVATITWNTNEVATSTVNYGTTISYDMSSSSASLVTSHSVTLTGLTQATLTIFKLSRPTRLGILQLQRIIRSRQIDFRNRAFQ